MDHPNSQAPRQPTPSSDPASAIVILGAGYTGRHLYAAALSQSRHVVATSRAPEDRLAWAPPASRLAFDLEREATWRHVPRDASLVWCFPASPPDLVRRFAERVLTEPRRLVVLGSTSAYDVARPGADAGTAPALDETAPIRTELPRVRGEEYLRLNHGAIVLRVAGIYGPGRNVLDWIRRGRVSASPRMVNLIHVEDLAAVCLVALSRGIPGETYNVSDGTPRRWADICQQAEARWGVTAQPAEDDPRPGKRIVSDKLTVALGYTCRHRDLYEALARIESDGGS